MMQSKATQKWWTDLVWWTDRLLELRYPYVLPFKNPRVPIAILRGMTRPDGQPGTVVVAGIEQEVAYLVNRLFEGNPQRDLVDEVPLCNLPRVLKKLRPLADLTIARVESCFVAIERNTRATYEALLSTREKPPKQQDIESVTQPTN